MTTTQNHPRRLSDRAHRVLFQLALHPGGDWVDLESIYTGLGLNSHQVRSAVTELRNAGMAERRYRYLSDKAGRRAKRTDFRLTNDTPSEASA